MDACQVTLVSLDELVCVKHQYRKFARLFDFKVIEPVLEARDGLSNYKGFWGIRAIVQVSVTPIYGGPLRSGARTLLEMIAMRPSGFAALS